MSRIRSKSLLVLMVAIGMILVIGNVAEAKKYVIKFSHNQPTDTPQHQSIEYFKQLVEERSNGRLEVQIYPAQQLGGLRDQVEGVQTGAIEMSEQPTAVITTFAPQLGVVDAPFLFPNAEVMFEVLDSKEVLDEIYPLLEAKDIKGFHFHGAGFKDLTSNKPIHSVADLKGMKYRVMPSPLLVAQFEAWGASAVPIDYAECYNALQQGVIDGVEWPITSIRDWKLWEVQKSITLTHHGYLAYLVIGNKRWFESLPSDLQDIILSAELEAAKKQRQLTTERESLSLTDIQKHMQVIRLTDEQKKGFQDASMNAWPVWKEKVGSDFFQKVENAVTRVAMQ